MNYDFLDNELETVNGLMTMTIFSIISEVLKVDLSIIELHSRLKLDLGMSEKNQQQLSQTLMEIFDSSVVDISSESNVQDIVKQVLEEEYDEQEYCDFI